jgi:hypothetical protein
VSATSAGDVYTLKMVALKMVVDASAGARVTEFSLDGANVLTGSDLSPLNYGSTYWPSPQSSWCASTGGCWPPIVAIDSGTYTGGIDAGTSSIRLVSGEASIAAFAGSKVTVTKQFTPVPDSGAIDVTYTLTNTSPSVTVSVADWQISRVPAAGGLTFFAAGTGSVTYAAGSDPAFNVTQANGTSWYSFAPVATDSKALADGAGWIAHVTQGRLLYLLAYPDIQSTAAAPGEAEIEIFTNSQYVEVETQGALAPIAPGATRSWTVRWKLRRVPDSTTAAVGSAPLESFVSTARAE